MALYSVLRGLLLSIFFAAAYAQFLSIHQAVELPLFLLITAFIMAGMGAIHTWLRGWEKPRQSVIVTLALLTTISFAAWGGESVSLRSLVSAASLPWFYIVASLTVEGFGF